MKTFISFLLCLPVSVQCKNIPSLSLDCTKLDGQEVIEESSTLDQEYKKDFTDIIEFVYGPNLLSQGGAAAIDMMFTGENLNNQKVLDIGSGLGGVDFYLAERFRVHIIGIDRVVRLIEDAKARKKNYQLCGDVDFLHQKTEADLSNFADESFDIVFSKESLLHVDNASKQKLLRHVFRILKPGGRIIVLDWLLPTPALGKHIKEMMALDSLDLKMVTPQQYQSFLQQAGFDMIVLANKNENYIKYTEKNVQHIMSRKSEFIAKFGNEDYEYSVSSWKLQKKVFQCGEVEVMLITATKPRG